MAFIANPTNKDMIGKKCVLTEVKETLSGYFEKGTTVTITDVDPIRGYAFVDSEGNTAIEAGFTGFELKYH